MSLKTRSGYFDTDEGLEIKRQLQRMCASSKYHTPPSYSPNASLYPDNLIPFEDKIVNYLINHPALEPNQYLANIMLMTKVR